MDLTRLVEGNLWWVPSGTAAVLLLGLMVYVAWRRPPEPLVLPLATVLVGAFLFTAGDLGSIFAPSAEVDWVSLLVLYAGHALLVPGCFYLALGVSKSHPDPPAWTRSRWIRLPIPWYALLWLSLVANPWHGLFLTANPGTRSTYHVLWYLFGGSGYALTATGFGLFLYLLRRAPPGYLRTQAIVMALATGITWVGNLVYVLAPTPLPFDPTAAGLCFTGTLFLVGAYRGQLFALNPVALQELARQDSDGVFVVDRAGALLFSNPAMNHWLGSDVPQPGDPGLTWLAGRLRLASDEAPEDGETLDLAVLERLVLSPIQRQGGHLFRAVPSGEWIRLETTPIRNTKNDEIAGHAIRVRNETTLHELIAAAADQASTLTAVMSASDEGILVHMDGKARWSNPQFHQIWGMPPEMKDASPDDIAAHCYPLVADLETFRQRIAAISREPGSTTRRDLELRDGRILEHSGTPLPRGGEVVGRVWRVRDVTEQRRSEEAVRRSQKLESLGLMAGGIAHDFNNLLVAVLGNASLARAELPNDSEARRRVEDIERAAERASDLTRQLLTYAGRGRLEVEAIDLSDLARGVAELMEVSISKRVLVRLDLHDAPPAVIGDASQLRQLVMNLLLNAAEAIGDEEGTVDVYVTERRLTAEELETFTGDGTPTPGRWLVLRVSDTGSGMDESVRARIFDPFFSTKFGGQGLGLAASLGIVRSHGGFIRVRSEPEGGAEFTVLLSPGSAPVPKTVATPAPETPWRSDATVLVVDDDPAVSRVAERMLRSAGLQVWVASDGSEALQLWETRGCADLVLLDLHMPGLSGEETWRALHRLDASVRVLFTSGYPEQEAGELLEQVPASAFIQKPYRTEQLLSKIRAQLEIEKPE